MKLELIPSILVDNEEEFAKRLRLVEKDVETVHVDILDGSLVPQKNWFDAEAVGKLDTKVKYELHLMVNDPLPILEAWKKQVAGTHRAIVHAEIPGTLWKVLEEIKGVERSIALNPDTSLDAVREHLDDIDQLTLMGVHPGASGQAFLGKRILDKMQAARDQFPNLPIEMDGGLTSKNIEGLKTAGCTRFCAASAVFSAKNPEEALRELQKTLSTKT